LEGALNLRKLAAKLNFLLIIRLVSLGVVGILFEGCLHYGKELLIVTRLTIPNSKFSHLDFTIDGDNRWQASDGKCSIVREFRYYGHDSLPFDIIKNAEKHEIAVVVLGRRDKCGPQNLDGCQADARKYDFVVADVSKALGLSIEIDQPKNQDILPNVQGLYEQVCTVGLPDSLDKWKKFRSDQK
jgi:hypothetical protein